MLRIVQTTRWRDLFWNELHPYPKILLCYLYDTADEAGFVDYSANLWLTQLKGKSNQRYSEFTKKDLINSLEDLKDKLLSNGKNKLFIKDFLKHQKKLPLIKGNEESELIIEKLQSNLKKFNDAPEIIELLKSVKEKFEEENLSLNKKAKKSTKFTPPSYEDFETYYISQSPETGVENIKELYDHYVSVGWKTKGGTPVKDYEAAIRNAIRRAEKDSILKQSRDFKSKTFGKESYLKKDEKQSRSQITFSVAEELKQETKTK